MAAAEGRSQFRGNNKPFAEKNAVSVPKNENFCGSNNNVPQGQTPSMNSFGRKYSICKSPFHLRVACDKAREGVGSVPKHSHSYTGQNKARAGQYTSPGGQSVAQVSVNNVQLDNRPTGASVISSSIGLQSADAANTTV